MSVPGPYDATAAGGSPSAGRPRLELRPPGPRRRPRLFWSGVVLAVALLAGGVVVATLGYAKTSGPDGAVRGYFAALARADAPSALAFGDLSPGVPHTLLTGDVLAEQQRIAPIGNVSVDAPKVDGERATVRVRYTLAFPGKVQPVTATVTLHSTDGGWRLDRAAIDTQLLVEQADQRATVLGAGVPDGTVAVFPGAAPIRFDSPFLQQGGSQDSVAFDSGATTEIFAAVSPAGRRAATQAIARALRACLAADADPRCPLPSARSIPGSLRGRLVGAVDKDLSIRVTADSVGSFDITGTIRINASYRTLSFTNTVRTETGEFGLRVHARAYGLNALTIVWQKS
ncbi:MAG: hypothetical protein ABI345_11675 [Jatrophihabitans sp.]